ncbi:MAG: glycine cleavage system aminomethyltransferase GcvT [Pirellulaceae bacterium]|jgi:aminomethyltransferase|nr:glycine cleavage system protein T [Planctomycetaceae bacterium]MDP6553665.1 glycine cleavage system aminomethyltransferase GcvT [Pirellulaceae bacterium]MDP6721356.1 glycine cleavage system aminomethyltransferase GcvT [Pirellulaceae bacterium]
MTDDGLLKTPLHQWHVDHGGRMVDFAGWSMPVQYTSIVSEHQATRTGVGLFDISHMGRLRFDGAGSAAFLDQLLTRRVVGIGAGLIRYSLVVNESGGILDDVLVYYLTEPCGESFHMLVVNASNRQKIVDWIQGHLTPEHGVRFEDQTTDTAMIAVQGPNAIRLVEPLVDTPVAALKYYSGAVTQIRGAPGIVSRTGYTGEDGCELIVPAADAATLWEQLAEDGAALGLQPAGLGARDTLRLEAAMPLYGHELSEQIDPYQAGLGFAVHLKDRHFIGHAALTKSKEAGDWPRRVGLQMGGKRVAREQFAVLAAGEVVGAVTSGTYSPTLERPIAMAYVRSDVADVGTELEVDIRGRRVSAQVVLLPFYRRHRT